MNTVQVPVGCTCTCACGVLRQLYYRLAGKLCQGVEFKQLVIPGGKNLTCKTFYIEHFGCLHVHVCILAQVKQLPVVKL